VLQVGDASGIQSPLSFGGLGALLRHARRLVGALDDALRADALGREDLGRVSPYNPALSAAWMLQRAMTAARAPGEAAPPDLINKMLGGNFAAMEGLGDAVMRPFLQVGCVWGGGVDLGRGGRGGGRRRPGRGMAHLTSTPPAPTPT
jgi:lycopene cyclase CruP